ncbi:beta-hexosaminidase 2 [Nymphaea colorata]|nr:beta-hexosaminidase 2 [Nymphaea colorata]
MATVAPTILFILLLLFSSAFFLTALSLSDPDINVWPKPRSIQWDGRQAVLLSPAFSIFCAQHPYLLPAANRYLRLIRSEHWRLIRQFPVNLTSSSSLAALNITVSDIDVDLQHGVDESYQLRIPGPGDGDNGSLRAETVWGAMRGLETFSQMVWGSPAMVPAGIDVSDWPLFPHRGLLLDTSRNFYRVRDILRTIRAMSHNKLNVFHWHITDSQSFPLLLPSDPDLARKGSYGPEMQYSPADVRRIVEFGRRHGVRVLPEIDGPAHARSWGEAHPEIVTCADAFWWRPGSKWEDRFASEPGSGQLNPLNPNTYNVVRNVVKDVTSLFPESLYHAGGDEVVPHCWESDPTIREFLSKGGNVSQLLQAFVDATYPYILSRNKSAVVYWEDILLSATVTVAGLPKETTILQTWNNGPNNTKRITSAGYRAIVSSTDFYYLDCGHGTFLGNDSRYDRQTEDQEDPLEPFNYRGGQAGSWCGPFKTWQRIYDYDITYGLNKEEVELVLGGEVALWSEQADATVLDGRVWPRASAMAEALWSGNRGKDGTKRYADASDRLNEWRYRMVGRGILAEPMQPLWCLHNPGMCNLDQ